MLDFEVQLVAEIVLSFQLKEDVQFLIELGLLRVCVRDQRGQGTDCEGVNKNANKHPKAASNSIKFYEYT